MIMKYRKKPIIIEAILYDGTNFDELWNWACPSNDTLKSPIHCGNLEDASEDYNILYVETLEGEVRVNPPIWIIKGIKGEFYPCKPDIFEQSYEEV